MSKKEKYSVSVYEYRCRRCQEIFTDTKGWGYAVMVLEMHNLIQSDDEIEENKRQFADEDAEYLSEKPDFFKYPYLRGRWERLVGPDWL